MRRQALASVVGRMATEGRAVTEVWPPNSPHHLTFRLSITFSWVPCLSFAPVTC